MFPCGQTGYNALIIALFIREQSGLCVHVNCPVLLLVFVLYQHTLIKACYLVEPKSSH